MRITESDIPFSKDNTQQIIPIIVALMSYLVAIFLILGLQLNTGLFKWNSLYTKSISITIPTNNHEKTADKITALLEQFPDIKTFEVLQKSEINELISPWFSKNKLPDVIKIPLVIDVVLKRQNARIVDNITMKTKKIFPKARISVHKKWVENALNLISGIQIFSFLMVTILVIITVAVVILTTRIELKLHHYVIELLHTIGAKDDYIARQFAQNAFWLGIKGAISGVFFAWLTMIGIFFLTRELELPFFSNQNNIVIYVSLGVVLVTVPFITTIFTKYTVIKNLAKMP